MRLLFKLSMEEDFIECHHVVEYYNRTTEPHWNINGIGDYFEDYFPESLYCSSLINRSLIKLAAKPNQLNLYIAIEKHLLMIMTLYKIRKHNESERKAKIIVVNIEYSQRMFEDVIKSCNLTAQFKACLDYISPTSESYMQGWPQIRGKRLAESLSKE